MLAKLSKSLSRTLPRSMASSQRGFLSSADAEFPAEKERYHLYVAYSCPFASRALTACNLKGLQDVVAISVAHPVMQKTKPGNPEDAHKGWAFVDPSKPTVSVNGQDYSTAGCTTDPIHQAQFMRDLYERVDPEPRAFSVPLLWDTKKDTIVNNESADLVRIFNSGFGDLATGKYDLVPEELKTELDAANNGVVQDATTHFFKSMFAKDVVAAEEETAKFFEALAKVDELLNTQRYLVGAGITEADIRLFHTLIRADVSQRASSKQKLEDFPNVVNYLRELYQLPAFKATVHWDHIKLSAKNFGSEPVGPTVDYEAAHDRARFDM